MRDRFVDLRVTVCELENTELSIYELFSLVFYSKNGFEYLVIDQMYGNRFVAVSMFQVKYLKKSQKFVMVAPF